MLTDQKLLSSMTNKKYNHAQTWARDKDPVHQRHPLNVGDQRWQRVWQMASQFADTPSQELEAHYGWTVAQTETAIKLDIVYIACFTDLSSRKWSFKNYFLLFTL